MYLKNHISIIFNNNKLLNVNNVNNVNNDKIMKFYILNQEFDINILSPGNYRHLIQENINITLNYYKNHDNSNYYKINLKDFF